MKKWSPYTLPHVRDKLTGEFLKCAEYYDSGAVEGKTGVQARDLAEHLPGMPLTWLADDICQMVRDTSRTVPSWSPLGIIPGESGFIAFEKPLGTVLWGGGVHEVNTQVDLDAVAWWTVGEVTVMHAFSRLESVRNDMRPEQRGMPMTSVFTGLVPTLDTVIDIKQGFNILVAGNIGEDASSAQEYNTWVTLSAVGAMWLLMSQPTVVEEGDPVRVTMKPRAGRIVSAPSVTVTTRRLTRKVAPGGGGRRGAGKQATKRWWVRGHWRQQAWGEGRKLRRPVFIAAHTAGAADKEPVDTSHVQVWRR